MKKREMYDAWMRTLVVLDRTATKLDIEYHRQQPDAPPDESWAEAEEALHFLAEYRAEFEAWRMRALGWRYDNGWRKDWKDLDPDG